MFKKEKRGRRQDNIQQFSPYSKFNGIVYNETQYAFGVGEPFNGDPDFNQRYDPARLGHPVRHPFIESPDVMCVGCSITAGFALQERYSWPSILASVTGETINICARATSGAAFEVFTAMQMMTLYGKPKKVICLFPDITRIMVCTPMVDAPHPAMLQQHIVYVDDEKEYFTRTDATNLLRHIVSQRDTSGTKQKIKKPKPYRFYDFQGFEYKIPYELAFEKNLQAVMNFELFCEINGIEFQYASWSKYTNDVFSNINSKAFNKPVNKYRRDLQMYWSDDPSVLSYISPDEFVCPDDTTCGHQPQSEQQESVWRVATNDWHPGLHNQIHFAEHFLGYEITNKEIAALEND